VSSNNVLLYEQPYSMCPLMHRVGHDCRNAPPPNGGARTIDFAERAIATMFIAPMKVQRAAQREDVGAVIHIRPRGWENFEHVWSK
jgi:hypothetical protein